MECAAVTAIPARCNPAIRVASRRAAATLGLLLLLLAPSGAAAGAAEKHAGMPPQEAAPPAPAAERVHVEGFRSARWGMTERQVKAAIRQDFGIPADRVHAEENFDERTTLLTIGVNELLEGAGKARVSYILGYASKKLIEVNIVWGTTIDPHIKPDRVVAAANQLRTLFLSSGYQPGTIASNVPTGGGTMIVFQGADADAHMTLLRLASAPAHVSSRQHRAGEADAPTVVLLLSYIENPANPDIYRLKKGQF
jgi:hypothetical protein